MTFLGWPAERGHVDRTRNRRRKKVALNLPTLFPAAFPDITYDLLWESSSVNAQAWRLGKSKHVRLYGGLIRHPALDRAGLAVILAHETGHHLF
jgi:Zn-dependent protease with chaperone function